MIRFRFALWFGVLFFLFSGLHADQISGNYQYIDNGETITITRYRNNDKVISIPNKIAGKPVTIIGKTAFAEYGNLLSITIPSTVTVIEEEAFKDCDHLTSITIPASVTSIGNWAFAHCRSLSDAIISNGVVSIGKFAFNECDSLNSVTIPNSVTSIGDGAFSFCIALSRINVNTANPAYTSLDGILYDKSRIQLIQYPASRRQSICNVEQSVVIIQNWAFAGCSNFEKINLPNNVTSIGVSAFFGCTGLKSVFIPCKVKSIGTMAFYGCNSLTAITFPSSLTSIDKKAFWGCSRLANVYFQGGAPASFSESAFMHTEKNFTIHYPKDAPGFSNPWHGYKALPDEISEPTSQP